MTVATAPSVNVGLDRAPLLKDGRRLRVVHLGKFYPPHRGGMETYLQTLCEQLRNTVEVEVIVANDRPGHLRERVDGVKVTRVATLMTVKSVPLCPTLAWTIRRLAPDLVHIHLPNPVASLAYLLSGHGGPLVATWHSDVVKQKGLNLLLGPLGRMLLRRCGAIIVTSHQYAETSPVLPAYRDRCVVIPLGISAGAFQRVDRAAVAALRERFGPKIVFSVGRLVYYKGTQFLIDAMKEVQGSLLVAGDGPLRAELQARARSNGVAHKVHLLGEVHDLAPYYHACDVFVLPSIARSEAFGIVQLEAMVCGKPVVNTALASGVPFVSIDDVTGITVPPASASMLASAVNLLLSDGDLRVRYGRAAASRVRVEFSLDRMVRDTLEIYRCAMLGNDFSSFKSRASY